MNKLEELKKMLDEVGIECTLKNSFLDCIINSKVQTVASIIHGEIIMFKPIFTRYEKLRYYHGLIETCEEIVKRIKYCVENNTDTYVEEETFEDDENVFYIDGKEKIIEWEYSKHDYEKDRLNEYDRFPYCEYNFISHSKRKCLEYLYVQSHKRELKEKETKKDLLKQMEEIGNEKDI